VATPTHSSVMTCDRTARPPEFLIAFVIPTPDLGYALQMQRRTSTIHTALLLTAGLACADSGQSDDGLASSDATTVGSETDGGESGTDESETDTGGAVVCGDGVVDDSEECDAAAMNGANSTCTPDCLINICGDGYAFLDGLEICDDGNDIDTDACLTNCVLATCGDGFIQAGLETCDDGNAVGGDGCSSECIEQKVVDVALGGNHTCALLSTGNVRCWGNGAEGRLGYGNTDDIGDDEHPASAGDVDVGGTVVQITAGYAHTCAVLDAGQVRCWGIGYAGGLGYPGLDAVGDDETPASVGDVVVGGPVVQVSAGENHTCALLDNGKVRCWGDGAYGQLGYGNTNAIGDNENPSVAGDVIVGYDAVQIAAGDYHTCALLDNGAVRCWGPGSYGRLGHGNTLSIGDDEAPALHGSIPIDGIAVQVTAGSAQTCVRLDTNDVRCWGDNLFGALGYPDVDYLGDNEFPTAVTTVEVGGQVIDISAGAYHTCAITEVGEGRCWGNASLGQLGYGNIENIGDDENPAIAGDVQIDGTAVRVVAGSGVTCAILSTGILRCWGNNDVGQLGLSSTENIGDDELPTSVDPVQVF
jgi:cysteine-rich repeat protein